MSDTTRQDWDRKVNDSRTIHRIAADLGLRGGERGSHFFCPGCQAEGARTPELVIRNGSFHCFRCGARGDVVGLVKLARRCDLESAIAWLSEETGEGTE